MPQAASMPVRTPALHHSAGQLADRRHRHSQPKCQHPTQQRISAEGLALYQSWCAYSPSQRNHLVQCGIWFLRSVLAALGVSACCFIPRRSKHNRCSCTKTMDPFSLLTVGAQFDKKRVRSEAAALQPGASRGGAHAAAAAIAPTLPAAVTDPSPSSKKRKKAHRSTGPAAQLLDVPLFAAATMQHSSGTAAAAAAAAAAAPQLPEVQTGDAQERANVIRKTLRIKVTGGDPPDPLEEWQQLLGPPWGGGRTLLANLAAGGWAHPSPIQRQAIPTLLGGRDLLGVAPTGSGKTLSFLVPCVILLRRWRLSGDPSQWPPGAKALLLSPTHELAAQTARVLRRVLPGSKLRACLLSKSSATGSDMSAVDILVANPLRLKALVEAGRVDLGQVRYLVLDEADKLLALGFLEQVDALLAAANHPGITRALFSATLPEKVEALARSVLVQPLRVTVGQRNISSSSVSQRLVFVGQEGGKLLALRQLLAEGASPPVLVFVATKERARTLHNELRYDGLHVDHISAEQSNAARTAAIDNFRLGRTWVLIATDLIGRGVDFVGVNTVVNYDFPNSALDYVHRVGRTGRAGHTGEAVTFFTEDDAPQLRGIANVIKAAGGEVPEWMLAMQKQRRGKHHGSRPAAGKQRAQAEKEGRTGEGNQQQRQQGRKAGGKAGGKSGGGVDGVKRRQKSLAGVTSQPLHDLKAQRKQREMVEASKRRKQQQQQQQQQQA